ncbi:MAG: CRISPR-associated helicase Cas3', partial [Bacteroidota bacterium]|nr:CRISPR-associated helicase Cas3' [Bacteroidota bacterium]
NYLRSTDEKNAIICAFLIFRHHGNLINLSDFPKQFNSELKSIFEAQAHDIKTNVALIEDELNLINLLSLFSFPDEKNIRKIIKIWLRRNPDIQDYFLINYLFSLLTQADKLDASETELYNRIKINPGSVDKRFGEVDIFDFKNIDLHNLSNNELRNYCRAVVTSHLREESILNYNIFTLTAPTGIGKTMTALDFALKLKRKIAINEDREPQIIYALPFINIIEQAISEYHKTVPNDAKILAHYQYADIFSSQDDSDVSKYNQKLMSLDTWQGDIVITSFVQFFETLIGNRNKLLKKFNHYAGSIIILDEVQTLRLDQMPLIGATLFYLTKFLNTRIILMTATKPKIFELAEKEILSIEKEKTSTLELLTNHSKVFSLFSRTAIHPILMNEKSSDISEFIIYLFNEKWDEDKSCLFVCNTVNRSIEIHDLIKDFIDKGKYKNPIYYLSTNIIPIERLSIINKIQSDIDSLKKPILISTQVIEAGVDLDFDMGFRDLGPIDSIIQVAGRINRNNNRQKKDAPLFIVDFNDCKKVYGSLTYVQSKKIFEKDKIIYEKDYLKIINKYFDNISETSSFSKSRNIFKAMKELRYDGTDDEKKIFETVSSFKIIEESGNYLSVFIESSAASKESKNAFLKKISNEYPTFREEQFSSYKRTFHQHIIAVPDYLPKAQEIKQMGWILSENIWYVPMEEVDNFYDRQTGFIRHPQKQETVCIL